MVLAGGHWDGVGEMGEWGGGWWMVGGGGGGSPLTRWLLRGLGGGDMLALHRQCSEIATDQRFLTGMHTHQVLCYL